MQADIYAYIMSASPPTKDTDVEQGDPTPENSGDMDRGDTEAAQRDAPFSEFDVKEQDRWLPIANGWSLVHPYHPIISGRRCVVIASPFLYPKEGTSSLSFGSLGLDAMVTLRVVPLCLGSHLT